MTQKTDPHSTAASIVLKYGLYNAGAIILSSILSGLCSFMSDPMTLPGLVWESISAGLAGILLILTFPGLIMLFLLMSMVGSNETTYLFVLILCFLTNMLIWGLIALAVQKSEFIKSHSRRVARVVAITISVLIVSYITFDLLEINALKKVSVLMQYPAASHGDLPEKVGISLDEAKAIYRKGTPEYDQFAELIGQDPTVDHGPQPRFSREHPCGELVIYRCGIPLSFRLYRSDANPNYMWIQLRKLTTPGRTYPTLIDDGRLLSLVRKTGHPYFVKPVEDRQELKTGKTSDKPDASGGK